MTTKSNPHEKHRQRVREEYMADGFTENTPPHKVLEMLLFYSIPRGDTNVIAHDLLNHFGSIAAVLDATPEELKRIKGIGDHSAILLNLVSHVCRLYQRDKFKKGYRPDTYDKIGEYLRQKHFGLTKEIFAVTTFNSKGEIIAYDPISKGDVTSVGISTRSVVEVVIERKAVTAIISHNHPSGNAMPSPQDLELTARVAKALHHINAPLMDHIILIDDDYVSLRQSEHYKKMFEKPVED